jgi:hypothetical protein
MALPKMIPLKVLVPALGGAFLMLLILLLIAAVSGRSRESEDIAPAPVLDLDFSDFIVDDPTPLADPGWLPVRPGRDKWEPEEIDQFWVDPVELGIQRLEEENDEMVRDFFEAIP